jgi:hemerythrin-like domain-containing protein
MTASRRTFMSAAAGAATTLFVSNGRAAEPDEEREEEVGATEDLMREHGVLDRTLLIYEEGLRRLAGKEDVGPEVFQRTASLVRRFIEEYHERLEEEHIFPEFAKDKNLGPLVAVLKRQHEAGRSVTAEILRLSSGDAFAKRDNQQRVATLCRSFITMYRPHSAREDTVVFPALREILSAKRIEELGEQFEEQEHKLFGEEGFQKTVEQVAEIERQLGIYDLEQFTPRL